MPRIKKYTLIFIKIGILAFILATALMGLKFGFWKGVFAGLIFGVTMSLGGALLLIPLDYLLTRKLPTEALSVHQTRELQVNGNFEQVFANCVDILKNFERVKNVVPLKNEKRIAARTKKSWLTFGENIMLQFSVLDHSVIKIDISSNPSLKPTLIDYGTNYRNVEWIKERVAVLT